MARSHRYEIGVGLLLAAALVVLAWMAVQVGAFTGFGDRVEVTAAFPSAAGLEEGGMVAVAGVQVGDVQRLELKNGKAVAHLSLDPEAGVPKDATASIRARSLLGEKFVALQIEGTGAPPAEDGDRLQVEGRRYDIDDLVAAMGPLFESLDATAINDALARFSAALDEDPERVQRMVEHADTILANTARASEQLPALALEARKTLAEGRSAARSVDARAREAEVVIARADAVLADLEQASEGAPEMMTEVEGAVDDARDALEHLETSTSSLQQVLDNLAEFDKTEVRRLLREEGVLVRLKSKEIEEPAEGAP